MSDVSAPESPVGEKTAKSPADRISGRVKWFDPAKGYGFVESNSLKDDVFVHHTEIEKEGYRSLKDGEEVTFLVSNTDQGLAAKSVLPSGG